MNNLIKAVIVGVAPAVLAANIPQAFAADTTQPATEPSAEPSTQPATQPAPPPPAPSPPVIVFGTRI